MGAVRPRRAWELLLLAVLGAAPLPALADGMYFAPLRVRPVPLSIPAQRAILVFRNGEERLTVESTLDARGQSFGWVVPVPAKPTAVEKATRGPLDLLDRVTEPDIVHGSGFTVGARSWLPWVLAFLFLSRAALVRFGFRHRGLGVVAGLGLLILVLPWWFSGPGGHRFGEGPYAGLDKRLTHPVPRTPGIRAEPTRRVGSYETTVLEADDANALGRWLETTGFAALPDRGKPIVDALVREGWSFVAVRLAREDEEKAAPHPLRIVFPAREPVYPMRLTSLAGGTTAVRLYVVANEGMTGPGMKVICRDRFRLGPRAPGDTGWVRGEGLAGILAHPRLLPDLWDGCVLTHLDGTFRSADMDRDIVLGSGPSEPFLARYWSPEGARDAAAAWSLVPWAILALVLLFVPPAFLPMGGWRRSPFLPCLLVLSAAAGLAFLAVRSSLPTVEVKEVRDEETRRVRGDPLASPVPEEGREDFAGWSDARIEERVQGRIPAGVGDSPGQFEVLDLPGRRVVRIYGGNGEPEDWTIPASR